MNIFNKKHQVSVKNNMREKGLSLVELMVAVVVGVILIGGVVQIYVGSKGTYRTQDALSRLQENGRYALNLLASDIRASGFRGCLSPKRGAEDVTIIANAPVPDIFSGSNSVNGYENTSGQSWTPSLPTGTSQVLDDTDAITVQHGGSCGAKLTGNMATANANVQIDASNTCGFAAGEAILISDCEQSDLFRATNVSQGSGKITIAHANSQNTTNRLSKLYRDDSELLKFTTSTYFIRNDTTSQVPSLWRLNGTGATGGNNPSPLVEGVENLQVVYGYDNGADGEPDQYIKANAVGNWEKVVSVRMTLLLRSIDPVHITNQTYTFAAAGDKTYTDRFTHQEVQMTVDLRNK